MQERRPQQPRKRDGGNDHVPQSRAADTDRLGRIEAILETIQQTLDVQFKRIASLQAEVDLLKASRSR